jgi:ceramide synthetase
LYTTTFEELTILGLFPAYYIFNGLLILLQILHYFWFYIICRVAISALQAGKVKKDERSDSEDSDDEQTTDNNAARKVK